ncbi:hypothetical protein MACH23_34500 [Sulfitobacter pontiacus]|nr:hypothetical protein MACH23_34500 [Sulfitobacter pontiacus]
MAPSGKLRRSENLPDEGLVWARERLPSTSERKGGKAVIRCRCKQLDRDFRKQTFKDAKAAPSPPS